MRGGIKELTEYTFALALIESFGIMPRSIARRAANVFAALGFHLARRQRQSAFRNLQMALPELTRANGTNPTRMFPESGPAAGRIHSLSRTEQNKHLALGDSGWTRKLPRRLAPRTRRDLHDGALRGVGTEFVCPRRLTVIRLNSSSDRSTTPVERLISALPHCRAGTFQSRGEARRATSESAARERSRRDSCSIKTRREAKESLRSSSAFRRQRRRPSRFRTGTGAAVVPGFLIWDEDLRKHRLRLDPPVELIDTGDLERDVARKHEAVQPDSGRLCPEVSRPVVVDSSPVEDTARRRSSDPDLPIYLIIGELRRFTGLAARRPCSPAARFVLPSEDAC